MLRKKHKPHQRNFHKSRKLSNKRRNKNFRKSGGRRGDRGLLDWIHPLILKGILLIIAGILVLRFSHVVFGFGEGTLWSWLVGWAFIIAGLLVLIAWWRNNVSMFTTKHAVKWN
jgi:hypothetical protein